MSDLDGATILLLGAGYSAREFARQVGARTARIFGTTRSAEKAEALRAAGIEPLIFDGSGISQEMATALGEVTHLVLSASPGVPGGHVTSRHTPPPPRYASSPSPVNRGVPGAAEGRDVGSFPAKRGRGTAEGGGGGVQAETPDEAGIDPLLALLPTPITNALPRLRWAGYLSTVGVYGDHGGAWVDETAEARPVSKRARQRVAAEAAWLAAGSSAGLPVAVLRLSGIYGPGRNALVNLERGTARRTVKPGQVFNRIHVADIAGALAFLADRRLDGIFNVSDDEPGPPQDVVAYAAGLMGVAPPPEIPFEQVEMSPMARSFWSDNKRVGNTRLREAGYVFNHPDHRHALDAMWVDGSWRGDVGDAGSSE